MTLFRVSLLLRGRANRAAWSKPRASWCFQSLPGAGLVAWYVKTVDIVWLGRGSVCGRSLEPALVVGSLATS